MKRAVIYIRVSDPSQIENNSLETQEKFCVNQAKLLDSEVVKIYREEGVSAKDFNRPEMRKLMAFCSMKKNKIDYVIVYKFNRWTRNVQEGLAAVALLSKSGVQLMSATEPSEQNPYGTFIRTIMMATAQLDNEVKGASVKDKMQTLFRKGIWCWKPPVGYKRPYLTKEENKGKPPVPHQKISPLIKDLFIEASSSMFNLTQLATKLNIAGFEHVYGRKATVNLVSKIIKNTFYYGLMYSKTWDEYQVGIHEPIVDEFTWKKANVALFHKKGNKYTYQDNKMYPLKGLLKAETTGRNLTSSNPTGKTKKHFYYERDGVRLTTKKAHQEFRLLLSQVKPNKRVLKLFEEMVFGEWDKQIGYAKNTINNYDKRINTLKNEIKRISRSREEGIYTLDEAKTEAESIRAEIVVLEVEKSDVTVHKHDIELVKNFTKYFLLNLDRFWNLVDLPMKQIVQKKIFPKGLLITENKEIRTPELSPLFELIKVLNEENSSLVSHLSPGWNPRNLNYCWIV